MKYARVVLCILYTSPHTCGTYDVEKKKKNNLQYYIIRIRARTGKDKKKDRKNAAK